MPKTTINEKNNVLVDLPYGKLTRKKNWVEIKAQKGPTCVLFAMRLIANLPSKENLHFKAYQYMCAELQKVLPDEDDEEAFQIATEEACKILGMDDETIKEFIINSHPFKVDRSICETTPTEHFKIFPQHMKNQILYATLNEKIFESFGVRAGTYQPKEGVDVLMDDLRAHGALLFSGKYGLSFYKKQSTLWPAQNIHGRIVHRLEQKHFDPNKINSHAIVVDQVKKVAGDYFVFFRDPNMPSNPLAKEHHIFAMDFQSFANQMISFPRLYKGKSDVYCYKGEYKLGY